MHSVLGRALQTSGLPAERKPFVEVLVMLLSLFRIIFCLIGAFVWLLSPAFSSAADVPDTGRVFDGRAILKLGKGNNMCAVTFDDGPGPHTARLLDILRERGVRATFFVVGSQLARRPQLIQRMFAEGHEVGNHTLSHGNLRHMPAEKQKEEIISVQTLLRKLGGNPRLIRPPYGRFDETSVAIAAEENADIVLWSVDSMDWMHGASIQNMQTQITGQKLRGIFLFHDTHVQTVDAIPEILDWLAADGCQFVTVSEFIQAEQPADEQAVSGPFSPVPSEGRKTISGEEGAGRIVRQDESTMQQGQGAVPVDERDTVGREPAGDTSVDSKAVERKSTAEGSSRSSSEPVEQATEMEWVPGPGDTLREYRHPLDKSAGMPRRFGQN